MPRDLSPGRKRVTPSPFRPVREPARPRARRPVRGKGPFRHGERTLRTRLLALPTYSEELGLRLERPSDWYGWFIASSLFAAPIAAGTARKAAKSMLEAGLSHPREIARAGWDRLVELLDLSGYTRYDFRTATKLLGVASALPERTLRALVRAPGTRSHFEAGSRASPG